MTDDLGEDARPDDEVIKAVLVFADGAAVMNMGRGLADLYAEDADAQAVLAWAGCHPRGREHPDIFLTHNPLLSTERLSGVDAFGGHTS